MKNWIIAALAGVIAIGGALGAFAATQTVETTETVEVRFWQGVNDNSVLWYKARPEGGDWTPITRLRMPDLDRSGNYHQGDIAIDVLISVTVEVPEPPTPTPTPTPPAPPIETVCEAVDGTALTGAVVRVTLPALVSEGATHLGTAFHVQEGLFISAGHVFEDNPDPEWITLRNDSLYVYARLLGRVDWLDGDIAILRATVPDDYPSFATVGGDGVFPGNTATVAGYPLTHTATAALVWRDQALLYNGRAFTSGSETSYYLGSYFGPGSSGSPVFDSCGELEGVHVAGSAAPPLSRFIDIATVRTALWDVISSMDESGQTASATPVAATYTYNQVVALVRTHFSCIVASGYNTWDVSHNATFENGVWSVRVDYKRRGGGGYGESWATFTEATGTIVTIRSTCTP